MQRFQIVAQYLAGQVYQIVAVGVAVAELVARGIHRFPGGHHLVGIVEYFGIAPGRYVFDGIGGSRTDVRLYGAAGLVVTFVYGSGQYLPGPVAGRVDLSIPIVCILLQPVGHVQAVVAPSHVVDHIVYDRNGSYTFGGCTYAAQVFPQRVVFGEYGARSITAHLAVQPGLAAEVGQGAPDPVVVHVPFGFIEHRTGYASPLRPFAGHQVENDGIALFQPLHEAGHGVVLPALQNPHGLGRDASHGLQYLCGSRFHVDAFGLPAFVKRVAGKVEGIAEESLLLVVVDVGYRVEQRVVGVEEGGPLIGAPLALLENVGLGKFLFQTVGYHAVEALEYGLHAQLAHAAQHLLLQVGLSVDKGLRNRSAEPLEVAHQPPGFVPGTGKKGEDFVVGISQTLEGILPDGILAVDGHERQVDALKSHAIYLLFPLFPAPKSHGIAVCAIIEVVSEGL